MIRARGAAVRRKKASTEMSTAELDALAAALEREFAAEEFRRPSVEKRKQWTKAKRKRGRPRVGKGAQVISVSVEKGLLKQADRLAKRLHVSRAQLISQGLQKLLRQ